MRVALAQFALGMDKAANLDRLSGLVADAAGQGAALVIAPEGAMHDFGTQDTPLAPAAEPLDGPYVAQLSRLAAARRVTLVAGMFEAVPGDDEHVYNTVVALGPDGRLLGSYRKQHLFDALGWTESDRLAAGRPEDRLTFDCEGVTVGVMTCYDIRFPELARALVDDGAVVLAVPSAWVAGPHKVDQWRTLTTARAIENVCYVAGAVALPPAYTGHSRLVDPFGLTVAELGEQEGLAAGDVAIERVAECRSRMPSLAHRRWEVRPRS